MKQSAAFFLLMVLMTIGSANPAWCAQPFALVELFSSEGCSSCPPADELLRQITQQANENNQRVFPLSFQVDYWDYLGWKDPNSQPEFTQRQYQYDHVLGTGSVYTPQMVINGEKAFVGSDGQKANAYIRDFLKISSNYELKLKLNNDHSNQLEINYFCDGPADAVLHFALVESGLESRVTSGENQGRTLKHANVVREFKTVALSQNDGSVVFKKPAQDNIQNFSIIAYLQDKATMRVLAAEKVDVK